MRKTLTAVLSMAAALVCAAAGEALRAQTTPVRVGWTDTPPIFVRGSDDALSGFGAELLNRIAERERLSLEFVRYESVMAVHDGFEAGEIDLFAASRPLPAPPPGAQASAPIATAAARLFVRASDAQNVGAADLRGQRIGYVAPSLGAALDELGARNRLAPSSTVASALFDLLSGATDASVMFDDIAFANARRAGVDHRIRPVGPPLLSGERVIVTRASDPALRRAVDRAIAALEADGALQALRDAWLPSPPAQIPDTLVVGVTHFPPYQVVRDDGGFTGFAVEALREIAGRMDLSLRFERISPEEFTEAVLSGRVDMLPQASITEERLQALDFTVPIDEDSISLFVDAALRGRVRGLDDLAGRAVGVSALNPGRALAEDAIGVELRVADTLEDLLELLDAGEVQAAVYSTEPFSLAIEATGLADRVHRVETPLRTTYRGIVLRRGLGQIREGLNAVIPVFLASSEYQSLRQAWFAPPVFWTDERLWWLAAAIWIMLAAAAAIVVVRAFRQRQARERVSLIDDVFHSAPLGFALFDSGGVLRVFNAAYRGMFSLGQGAVREGARHEDLLAEGVRQGLYDLEGEEAEAWIAQRRERIAEGDADYDLPLSNGKVIHAVNRRTPSQLVFGVYQDVTLERRRERELDALNRRLKLVLDTATNGVVAFDRAGRIVMINPSARHMLGGVSNETPFAWPDSIRFLEAETLTPLEASRDPVQRALAGQRLSGETNLMTRASSEAQRYVRVSSAPVGRPESELRAVVVFDDVTVEEVNRQQIERRGRLDALGQLTGGIAHDFNNLLGTILNSVEVVALDPQTDRGRRLLDNAVASVRRGATLTGRLLSFASKTPGVAVSRSVKDVFASMETLVRPTIEETIAITLKAPDEDLPVYCDQSQLENAILNLVLNARDAIQRSEKGDAITIAARGVETSADDAKHKRAPHVYISGAKVDENAGDDRRGDGRRHRYVEISVSDNGPGMSEEVKRRAIDPFFTTKGANSGTGLGLSTVYGFVQQAGGELRIYSEPGLGTSVRMLLPRGETKGRREAPFQSSPLRRGAGETVLVVEDEPSLLASLTESLVALGYTPIQAVSGVQALEVLESGAETIDLLLTDIVMPGGVGGFELASRARQMAPGLPIIYMSGYIGFSTELMSDAIAQMIQKPCSLPELSTALRAALDDAAIS